MQALNDIQFARLLSKHKSIVLQGIGTFTLSETAATAQRMGRDFQPPRSELSFQQQESSENRLPNILLKETALNIRLESDAAEISNNYIVGIKFQLEKSGAYHFPGLGTLKINDAGNLNFTDDVDAFNYGLPGFSTDMVAKQISVPIAVRPKRRRKVRVWLVLLILILGGGVASWFFVPEVPEKVLPVWEKAMSLFEKREAKTDTIISKPVDTTQNIVVPTDTLPRDSSANELAVNEGPLTYFVIAGSFVDKTEADQYCNTLKQKGYSQAVVVVSQGDGRIRAAYQGFSTREAAIEFLNKTKIAENKNDIWLLHQN